MARELDEGEVETTITDIIVLTASSTTSYFYYDDKRSGETARHCMDAFEKCNPPKTLEELRARTREWASRLLTLLDSDEVKEACK